MDKKLCLDTDICIDILKNNARIHKLLEILENEQIYISSITMFELLLRKTNLEAVEKLFDTVGILYFDDKAARIASEIYKDLSEQGKVIEIRNIFIAACTIVNNCNLITFNKKDFLKIKGLKLFNF